MSFLFAGNKIDIVSKVKCFVLPLKKTKQDIKNLKSVKVCNCNWKFSF